MMLLAPDELRVRGPHIESLDVPGVNASLHRVLLQRKPAKSGCPGGVVLERCETDLVGGLGKEAVAVEQGSVAQKQGGLPDPLQEPLRCYRQILGDAAGTAGRFPAVQRCEQLSSSCIEGRANQDFRSQDILGQNSASALAVVNPIRRPVKEPGPIETAITSI
jgi:hypothetical protein